MHIFIFRRELFLPTEIAQKFTESVTPISLRDLIVDDIVKMANKSK